IRAGQKVFDGPVAEATDEIMASIYSGNEQEVS
ncbi:MAG: phosphonate ABC transporter ATP-binding protein, partial [Lacticaseibacillus paracasei]